jgi:transcriptional/translational regulatory protein YebC/TACO1
VVAVRCMSLDSSSLPIRLIPSPVAGGSADPSINAALVAALRAAKSSGVPRANIENALKKVRDSRRDPCLALRRINARIPG